MTEIAELLARWNTGEGKPYKGRLIDWSAYEANPDDIGCMCAQGQVLHLHGGWDFERLRSTVQSEADRETARLLNISRSHAVLLRNINDRADGAPSIVLTDPGKVLGDQWSRLLDFWWTFDQFNVADWQRVDAAWSAARDAAWAAAWSAVRADAWAADRAAAGDVAGDVARDAARAAAWEIQGYEVLTTRGRDVFFLPMFGWASPADIPARPLTYGNGVVPFITMTLREAGEKA